VGDCVGLTWGMGLMGCTACVQQDAVREGAVPVLVDMMQQGEL
jgi:hypothetical protein